MIMGGKVHPVTNTYRLNSGVPYLVKNKEDYEEMIESGLFNDYEVPSQAPESKPSETSKERKLREQKEAKAAKKKLEDADSMKVVPVEQTDSASSIKERPSNTGGKSNE